MTPSSKIILQAISDCDEIAVRALLRGDEAEARKWIGQSDKMFTKGGNASDDFRQDVRKQTKFEIVNVPGVGLCASFVVKLDK